MKQRNVMVAILLLLTGILLVNTQHFDFFVDHNEEQQNFHNHTFGGGSNFDTRDNNDQYADYFGSQEGTNLDEQPDGEYYDTFSGDNNLDDRNDNFFGFQQQSFSFNQVQLKDDNYTEAPQQEEVYYESELSQVLAENTNYSTPGNQSNHSERLPNHQNGAVSYNTRTLPKCPHGLQYYENENNEIFCLVATQATSFPPMCPYPNHVEYFLLRERLQLEIPSEVVWSFAIRNTSERIPQFLWVDFILNPVAGDSRIPKEHIHNYENVTNEGCLVLNGTHLLPEDCTKMHPGICVYPYDSYISIPNDTCKIKYNEGKLTYNKVCFSNNLGSQKKCYCITETQISSYPRDRFCKNLAELSNPYENYLLRYHLPPYRTCWIGLQKNKGAYQWASTNSSLNYTYWDNSTDFRKNYGALRRNGWILENDGNLYCAICKINFQNRTQVKLRLEENLTTNIIEVEIRNAADVYQNVVCFAENEMKIVNFSSNTENIVIINLWNSADVTGICWCRAAQISTLNYIDSNIISISNKTSHEEVCAPSITSSGNISLHWPETIVGGTVIPDELCVQKDGSPVTRTCEMLNSSINWLPVNDECADVTFAPQTLQLHSLLRMENLPVTALTSNLSHITDDHKNITSFQIHLVSKILEKASIATEDVKSATVREVLTTISNVVHCEPRQLKEAQKLLNSTDAMLYSLDKLLENVEVGASGYKTEVSEKLLIQVSNIEVSGMSGIILHPSKSDNFESSKVESLLQNNTLESNLLEENLEIAMLTPPELYHDIINCPGSKTSPKIITTVFYDDTLFNQPNKTGKVDGRIVGVTIPGFNCYFAAPIQIIFKSSHTSNGGLKCASWVYGSNIRGYWSPEGSPKVVAGYHMCEFNHVTHFSLLILGDHNANFSKANEKALDIITAIGTGLSMLGLLGIFTKAILSASYRSANGVIINFSIAIAGQIVMLFCADMVGDDRLLCSILGAALHYIVLSQLCWMLVVAILQYRLHVLAVYNDSINHLTAKACVFAWGVPLLPVSITISISMDNYGQNSHGICYAMGNYFTLGVLVPVAAFLLINLIIFSVIMTSRAASRRNVKVDRDDSHTPLLQLRLAFLLYFLLGLSWGFGLMAAAGTGVIYSYIFCLTATMQGFVLFMFSIVLNERTRSLWTNMKVCCGVSKSNKYDVTTGSSINSK